MTRKICKKIIRSMLGTPADAQKWLDRKLAEARLDEANLAAEKMDEYEHLTIVMRELQQSRISQLEAEAKGETK